MIRTNCRQSIGTRVYMTEFHTGYPFLLPIETRFVPSQTAQQKVHGTTVPSQCSPSGSWQLAELKHVSAGPPPVVSSFGAQATAEHQSPSEAAAVCKAAWLPSSKGYISSRLGNTFLGFVCHTSARNLKMKNRGEFLLTESETSQEVAKFSHQVVKRLFQIILSKEWKTCNLIPNERITVAK